MELPRAAGRAARIFDWACGSLSPIFHFPLGGHPFTFVWAARCAAILGFSDSHER
jgi:hypothetical protein